MKRIIYIDNFLTGHGHTPTTGTTLVRQFRAEGYTIIPASSRNNKALRLLDMVGTIISNRKNSFVLIATYSEQAFYFASICAAVCRLCNIPYVPCLHGGHLPGRIRRSPGLSAFYFGHSFTNVVVSGYLKQLLEERGWRTTEIPNNIQLENYTFRQRTGALPRLFWARSFHLNYNPQLAIRVLYLLRKKYPGAVLTMAGPDKDDDSLAKTKEVVKELKLEEHVTFTGLLTQKEWTGMASSFDIFINTSIIDNLPVSVIEAMAMGMIVVTTRVGGIPFLISNEKNGMIVPSNDDIALAAAIEKVLENQSLATILSTAAGHHVRRFDWKNVKQQWQQLFINISV